MKYDILLCAATYDSPECAMQMLWSTEKLKADCLVVISGFLERDLEEISRYDYPCDVVLMKAPRNCMYLCRNWGFIWAVHEGISADFMFSMDDDLEFIDTSGAMFPVLKLAREDPGFSVMGFRTNAPAHMGSSGKRYGIFSINPVFIDGNLNITQWEDNLLYGLPDSLPDTPMSYFTETEYQHRLRVLSGRSTVLCDNWEYYIHHFRSDPVRMAKRSETCPGGIVAGLDLWKVKYGITNLRLHFDAHEHSRVFGLVKDKQDQMRQHILYDGLWNDWDAIYDKLKDQFIRML